MKVLLMLAAGVFVTATATAQVTEGKMIYERKMNAHRNLPPEAEQFKAMVPEFNTTKMELAFKGQQSLYKPFQTDEDDLPVTDQGGGGMRMRFGGAASGEIFKDYEKDTKTEIRELGPKKYLLDDSLKHYVWKLAKDTMTVAGHLCHKATTTIKAGALQGMGRMRFGRGTDTAAATPPADQQVVAWYADDIASPSGPDDFGGLPGLILLVDVEDGLLVYSPIGFDTKAGTVKAPSNGKKISRDEYKALAEPQTGNIRRGGPGGGSFIIRGN